MRKLHGVTPQQELFARAYCRLMSATDAYYEAYKVRPGTKAWTVHASASKLMALPNVRARVAEIMDQAAAKVGLSVERTLKEVARLAYFDPRRLRTKDGHMIPIQDLDDDTAAAIAGTEDEVTTVERDGKVSTVTRTRKLKFHDKNSALNMAMRHHGLYDKDNAQMGESMSIKVVFE